jgi:hypothetical protein
MTTTTETTTRTARYVLEGQKGAARRVRAEGTVRYDPADAGGRDSPLAALLARIERETGCSCWPVREDHRTEDRDGRVTSTTYEITLSRRVDQSSSSVEGACWAHVYASPTCTEGGCPRAAYAKGLCQAHYFQTRRAEERGEEPELRPVRGGEPAREVLSMRVSPEAKAAAAADPGGARQAVETWAEAETLTAEQIESLRIDAGTHGDTRLVATCRRAADGDQAARATVARVLRAARAAE